MQTKKFILLSNQINQTMRKLLLLIILLGSFVSYSQDTLTEKEKAKRQKNLDAVNPFHKFGYKAKVATLSKGKYLEMFITDSIVQIGSFHYNILSNKVTGFTQIDTLHSEATLRPEVVSRWINPDPLSDEFPDKSPYNFVNNNPLRFVDPTGMAPEDIRIYGKNNKETPSIVIKTDAIDIDVHTDIDLPMGYAPVSLVPRPYKEISMPDDLGFAKALKNIPKGDVYYMSVGAEATAYKGVGFSVDLAFFSEGGNTTDAVASFETTYSTKGLSGGATILGGLLKSSDNTGISIKELAGKSKGTNIGYILGAVSTVNSETYSGVLGGYSSGLKAGYSKYVSKSNFSGGWGNLEKYFTDK